LKLFPESGNDYPKFHIMHSHIRTLIILLAILAIPALSSPALALQMSSKRDCVVCHIMWMDDFRTDKETLIEWQPTNVLMRDTQGVVSSEDICYSCHDGYINDSRFITWKHKRHPVYVKPSENISLPMNMPLSVNGEIYCGTCHSAHGKGAAPHGNPMGLTSFFREIKVDSNLCELCHRNEPDYTLTNGHPVNTNERNLPDKLFSLGSKKAEDKNRVICQTCHKVHGAKGDKILIVNNKNSELCGICHENQKVLTGTKHDLRLTLPDEKNLKQQTVAESGPCGACHTPHAAAGKKLWARNLDSGNPATEMCMTCHGKGNAYKIKGVGNFTHPINVDPNPAVSIPDDLPLFSPSGARHSSGRIQCFTCHNVHQWDPGSMGNKGGKDVEGDSSNSFLRIANNSASDLCLTCHVDKKQLIHSDHNLDITAPDEKNFQGFNVSVSGPCGACHLPHNAADKHIWAKELSGDTDFVTQLCTGCHRENGPAKDKYITDYSNPVNVTLEKFNITTTLPLYDNEGKIRDDGRIVCITCHEPHIWNPDRAEKNSPGNKEGDASNSFLRKSNSPSSELCKTCHAAKAFIDGTDHDLTITAPDATNILGQTARESGQCGVCHLVHNGPNVLKLWARPFGTFHTDEGIINDLCTSCHSEGKVAESKLPLIATHPRERLINNVMRDDRSKLDFAPIFDREGKEVNVGNISCPTCHNAHQWSPLDKKKGIGKNLEGNATNSFLRNVSYDNICIDCHGLDALFRYKYYHNPKERIENIQQSNGPVIFR
jgi:predicted CXXCH cytochrome family protein